MNFFEKVKSIKDGGHQLILGSWLNTASPIVAEVMSSAGFDFLCVDAEHSAIDIEGVQKLFMAINSGSTNCVPIVRMQGNNYWDTKRFLDAGAMGVIAPLVNSKSEAENLVNSVYYPPLGRRGVGYGRSSGYGYNLSNYMEFANKDIFVGVQIEHYEAVENIDEILSVKGIDAVFIGPYDLSASMGITADFNNPLYLAAIERILECSLKNNLICGIHVVQPNTNEVEKYFKAGYKLIAYSLDITIIGNESRNAINIINKFVL